MGSVVFHDLVAAAVAQNLNFPTKRLDFAVGGYNLDGDDLACLKVGGAIDLAVGALADDGFELIEFLRVIVHYI